MASAVSVCGGPIRLWINGEQICDVVDPAPFSFGGLGLHTSWEARARFEDVVVTLEQDSDADGSGDACDPCPHDPLNDVDQDGLCGDVDNCPATANPDQADADEDDAGDLCDPCPYDPLDDDRDGVCGDIDPCPNSRLGGTVVIETCDPGVPNLVIRPGCTLMDLVNDCARTSPTRAQYLSCVVTLANDLRSQGFLSGRQMGQIQRCASRPGRAPTQVFRRG